MKSTKFSFFLIFFLISFLGIKNVNANLSPHKYGWVHKFYEYPGKYISTGGCTDPVWTGGNVYYNVVLEYSTVYTDLTQVQALGNKLNLFYNPKGIFLNIVYVPNICDCPNQNSSGLANGRFPNCVHGVVVDEVAGVPGGQVGYFFVEEDEGDHNLIHELGHALGLKHTFDGFREIPSTHESITRTGSADCECNCLTNGDRICDTQPDPYYVDHPDENNKMFDYQKLEIKNEDQLKDPCGVDYKQISNVYDLIYNVMSYHPRGVPWERLIMTAGQVSAIKFKNASKPWNNGGPSNGTTNAVLSNGMTVNTPTTISNNIIFNGDLIVNSILNINDCSLMFAGKKIVVNAGGILIVNNSKLIPFSQSACFSTSTTWSGIEVKHGSSSAYIEIKNNSKIYGFAPYGITNLGNSGNARININSGSLISSNFPDIDAIFSLNSKALVTIKDATVSGGITLRNTIYGSLTCINANQIGSIKLVNSTLKMSHGSDVGNILVDNTFANLYIDIKNSKLGTTKIQESIGKIWIQNNDILNLDIGDVGTYAITNNNFIYNNSPSNTPFNISNKAGTNINKNLFFKNSLQGTFSVAQITAGPPQNGGSSPGLAVECNTGLQMSLFNRIAPVQGDDKMAAGNKFSGFPHVNYNVNSKLKYHFLDKVNEEPESITGNNASLFEEIQNDIFSSKSKCDFDYPKPPDYPDHCSNGVQDANEIGIDCGGSCRPCKLDDTPVLVQTAHCGDGIQNNGETGVDCGGKHCPPCDACNDGMMNYGETGVDCGGPLCPPCNVTYCNNQLQDHGETDVDCGGPCPPCNVIPPSGGTCTDGVLNNGETQVDCGGPNCAPCPYPDPVRPSCTDGIKNGTETGVDCGGVCPPCIIKVYLNSCYDGIKNYGETGIDCGGPCPACKPWAGYGETGPISGNSGGSGGEGGSSSTWLQRQTSAAARAFISALNNIYGSDIIPLGGDLDIRDEKRIISSMMDEGSTGHLVSMIKMYSASQPATVLSALINASPYVSDRSMHTMFAHSQYFTQAEVADIIRRNPGLLDDPYVSHIVEASASFTTPQVNAIRQAESLGDARTVSNERLRIRDHYMQALTRLHMESAAEGYTPDYDEIRSLLLKKDDHQVIYDIYETFIAEGQYQFATSFINVLDASSITDPYYRNQLEKFRLLHEIMMKYYYAGNRSVAMPDPVMRDVEQIAGGCHGYAAQKARSIMRTLYDREIANDFVCNHYATLTFKNGTELRHRSAYTYTIHPNPVKDQLEITGYDASVVSGTVSIYDVLGTAVIHQTLNQHTTMIDVSALPSGTYIYKITDGKKLIQTDKFIKLK